MSIKRTLHRAAHVATITSVTVSILVFLAAVWLGTLYYDAILFEVISRWCIPLVFTALCFMILALVTE